jgi:hypothetical protein
MGFLSGKKPKPELKRLPTGTFTVDADCRVVSSTVPGHVSEAQVRDIGKHVLAIFADARAASIPFNELIIQYAAFKITAREMRGGAIVFLSPKALQSVAMP